MIGAIIGDIVGSRFEFRNTFDYNFKLFHSDCDFTDDTICTIAVADAILKGISYKDSLLSWCRKYPNPKGAYGGSFSRWINSSNPQPYNSFGNGAAMRVSPVGWAFDDWHIIMREAFASASPSHNHPEGLIGAAAVALCINSLRKRTLDYRAEIELVAREFYGDEWESNLPAKGVFDETCQGCVPLAFHILKNSDSFEDAIRKAVSYGGDSDTLGAIVGSLAEAVWGVPEDMEGKALDMLPDDMRNVCELFDRKYKN